MVCMETGLKILVSSAEVMLKPLPRREEVLYKVRLLSYSVRIINSSYEEIRRKELEEITWQEAWCLLMRAVAIWQPITAQIHYNVAEPNTQWSQARLCGLYLCNNRNMPATFMWVFMPIKSLSKRRLTYQARSNFIASIDIYLEPEIRKSCKVLITFCLSHLKRTSHPSPSRYTCVSLHIGITRPMVQWSLQGGGVEGTSDYLINHRI